MLGIQRHIIQAAIRGPKRTATLASIETFNSDFTGPVVIPAAVPATVWDDGVTDPDNLTTLVGSHRELPAGSYNFELSGQFKPGANALSNAQFQIRTGWTGGNTGTTIYNTGTLSGNSDGSYRTLSASFSYTSATAFTISPVISVPSGSSAEKPALNPTVTITEL